MSNSEFNSCIGYAGGAIYVNNLESTSYIQSSKFFNNTCKKNGGGLLIITSHLSL